jgi:hypothetical protein
VLQLCELQVGAKVDVGAGWHFVVFFWEFGLKKFYLTLFP